MNELRDSNPLDLGEVTVNLRTILQPGDRVPELDVETTGGKRVKLADFRGKVVLLDFWATWCGPCVAKMPKLKALYKKLRGGGKFEIIGLSLDRSVEAAKGFAERENLTWVQCYLGEWTKTPIPERYAVSSIPAFFLVGPDGRLLAKGFRLETIQEELEKAVSKLSSTKSVSERPVSNDPYSVLTEKVRLDWTAAMAAIQDNEEERFKAYLMSSHLTSGLFDAFRTAAGLLPDVDSRLATAAVGLAQRSA